MSKRVCIIRVDGHEIESLYEDMIALEICDQEAQPSTFALKLGIFTRPDHTWTLLDDGEGPSTTLRLWQRITVEAGFEGTSEVLIDGYIAGIQPEFGISQSQSSVLVWGHDVGYSMQQEEKIVAWEDRKFSDVAVEIFVSYGLEHEVEDSQVVHGRDDSLLLQRGTDWDFLDRLAAQLGYELFIRGAKGYFRKPKLATTPLRDIAVGLDYATTNAIWFKPKIVGDRPTTVKSARVNPLAKTVESVSIDVSPQRPLGQEVIDDLRSARRAAARATTITQPVAFGSEQEMEAFAEAVRRHHDWIVEAEGEVDGKLYGAALRARAIAPVRGAGRQFSGDYYLTKVIHRFTLEEYRQRFWGQRNATEERSYGALRTPAVRDDEGRVQTLDGQERVTTRIAGREVS